MKLEIAGNRVLLRPLRLSDAPDIYRNINHPDIVRWTLSIPHPYTRNFAEKFIRKAQRHLRGKHEYIFGIVLRETGKIIGVTGLHEIDWDNGNAELGYWIAQNHWGKGLTVEAVALICEFGFAELQLRRIYACLFDKNVQSRRVLEKSGFQLEGRFRDARFRYGRWHDELKFSLLSTDTVGKK